MPKSKASWIGAALIITGISLWAYRLFWMPRSALCPPLGAHEFFPAL
jgi:hypothetical protein